MVSLVGFLPAHDPRVLATIDATEERLTDQRGLVYRYRSRDGLEGEEGTLLLSTFWLAQALAERDGYPYSGSLEAPGERGKESLH
jgi:GH15 family glucan-1,4-alpha-glucosidase